MLFLFWLMNKLFDVNLMITRSHIPHVSDTTLEKLRNQV